MTEDATDLYVSAGHLLMTSSGDYSDYHTGGCFVTLEPLYRSKLQELRERIVAEYDRDETVAQTAYDEWEARRKAAPPNTDVGTAPQSWTNLDKREMFIAAMIRNGWLLAVTYTEMHIGSYGDLELSL
jgi:hypothetical protein